MSRASKTPLPTPADAATTIGPAIQISGRIEGEEDLRVLGRVDGAISLSETLYVEADGIVQADVTARDVVISGIVLGNITAENSVTLNPGARLIGNIAAPRLIISDGAAFAGDVEMGDAPNRSERDRARAKSYVPITASSGSGSSSRSTARSGASSTRSSAPARASAAAPARAARTSTRTPARSMEEDDITVVVKHSELARGEEAPAETEESATVSRATPKAKKKTRVRVPTRGKRRVNRR